MNKQKFPKLIDYQALKALYAEDQPEHKHHSPSTDAQAHLTIDTQPKQTDATEKRKTPLLSGTRLRSYAFALLTRKEYGKAELIEKLSLYAENHQDVLQLVEELAQQNYQSDQRVADGILFSQKRKGKGPNRIKLSLKSKKIDSQLIQEELQHTDWLEQAYQLKIKKFGTAIEKDHKQKAKQVRFLLYRGFDMETVLKAVHRKIGDE